MRKIIVALGLFFGLVAAAPGPAGAGGWVAVSLDSTPTFVAGERVDVGFTVLRHGVTPESNDDMVVVLADSAGRQHRFDVVAEGAVGHHVVMIEVPDVDSFSWKVIGPFVDAELGRVDVTAAGSGGGVSWTWDAVQWGTLALAAAMAGLAGRDVYRTRRLAGPATS